MQDCSVVVVITWFVVLMTSYVDGSRDGFHAKRLYDDKLKKSRYSRLIRPVGNLSDSLQVRVGLRLTSIIDVVSITRIVLIVAHKHIHRFVFFYVSLIIQHGENFFVSCDSCVLFSTNWFRFQIWRDGPLETFSCTQVFSIQHNTIAFISGSSAYAYTHSH